MKNLRSVLSSLAITALLVWALLYWSGVGLAQVLKALGDVPGKVYWAALAVQLCIYPLRAARFRALLRNAAWEKEHRVPTLGLLLPITLAHSLMAYVLPAKVGEASLVLYLRRGLQVPAARGLAVLFVARLLDLVCVTAFLAVACLVVGGLELCPDPGRILVLGAALLPLAFLMAAGLIKGAWFVERLQSLLGPLTRRGGRLGSFCTKVLQRLGEALGEVSNAAMLRAALWSPPIWLGVFLFYAILAQGFGLQDLGFAQSVFGAGLAVLFGLLPISAFAGFGSQDAGWVVGFTAMGAVREVAMESGLAIHLLYALHIVVLGLIGHAWALRQSAGFEPLDQAPEDRDS
ncbi:MAG: lysylphosphatidylglycerol synthase transmembrane domain-containing protein [Planctomycetota bacterium]|nr:lysylphosphatidylglycerol synthase transmembrane domain-containing protein [Planctomycetota bacterium]